MTNGLKICVSVCFTHTSEKGKVLGESQTRRVYFSIDVRQVLCLLPSRFLLASNISVLVMSWIPRLFLGVPAPGRAPWTILGKDGLWTRDGVASAVSQRSFRDTTQGPARTVFELRKRYRALKEKIVISVSLFPFPGEKVLLTLKTLTTLLWEGPRQETGDH